MRLRSLLMTAILPMLVLSFGCDSADKTTTSAPAPTTAPPPPPANAKSVAPGAPSDAKAKPIE